MIEFDCSECGRHIVAIVVDEIPEAGLCALCVALPSWHESFEYRRVFGEAAGAAWPFP